MSKKTANPAPPRAALSIVEAAAALGVSRGTIFALLGDGSLPYLRIGRRRLIPTDAIAAFIDLRTIKAGSAA